jgi:hypothetical protein
MAQLERLDAAARAHLAEEADDAACRRLRGGEGGQRGGRIERFGQQPDVGAPLSPR